MKITEMSIEQLRKHFAELSRDQLLLSLQTREAQIEAAQPGVQADGDYCVCKDIVAWNIAGEQDVCIVCKRPRR